jgi:hypothetical protein
MIDEKENITRLLYDLTGGKREVVDSLMPLVYKELHQLAHYQLRKERRGPYIKCYRAGS